MKFRSFLIISVVLSAFLISCNSEEEEIGNWVEKAVFEGYARGEGTSFAIDGKGFFGMGKDIDANLSDFWRFDPVTNAWSPAASFPGKARAYNVSISNGVNGYVGLGYDGDNDLADFWEYNAAKNEWNQIADFPGGARRYSTAFAIGTDIYVGTGNSNNDKVFHNDFYKYSNGTWTKITSLSGEKRRKANSIGFNGKGYILSGYHNGILTDFWSYDPATDSWTKMTSLTDEDYGNSDVPRQNANIFVTEGKLFVANGNASTGATNTVFEWDPATSVWTKKTSFEGNNREGAGCFVINDKAYIVGGHNGSAYYDECLLFEPSQELDSED